MLRIWGLKNTFINNLLPRCPNYLNKKHILRIDCKKPNHVIINNNNYNISQQRVTTFRDIYRNKSNLFFHSTITEIDNLYPRPYTLVTNHCVLANLEIIMNNTNIQEEYYIRFNHPNDFEFTVLYNLKINNNIVNELRFIEFPNGNFINNLKQTDETLKLIKYMNYKLNLYN